MTPLLPQECSGPGKTFLKSSVLETFSLQRKSCGALRKLKIILFTYAEIPERSKYMGLWDVVLCSSAACCVVVLCCVVVCCVVPPAPHSHPILTQIPA